MSDNAAVDRLNALVSKLVAAIRPPPNVTVSEWAAQNRVLSPEEHYRDFLKEHPWNQKAEGCSFPKPQKFIEDFLRLWKDIQVFRVS